MSTSIKAINSPQIPLDLGIEVQKDINGIEMGVLENGIPYLTQRGLATVIGTSRSTIQTITKEWEENYQNEVLGKDRISFFKNYLFEKGYQENKLHIETTSKGNTHYAYPDIVCMAFLEYYAFEAKDSSKTAIENYRKFASSGLKVFIYKALGYSPEQTKLDSWKHFHDRMDITQNAVPIGFWSVFKEMAVIIVPMIKSGIMISDKVVPDISVGKAWSEHWKENNLEDKYGERIKYDHEYPPYYPQAKSNPHPSYAYPIDALGEFRKWLQNTYLRNKFPTYLLGQAQKGAISPQVFQTAIQTFSNQQLK